MSKNLFRIFILTVMVLSMTFIFAACVTDGATIKSIEVKEGQVTEFTLSEFSLSKIVIVVTDSNDKVTERTISADMLSEDDLLKLQSASTHEITITYGGQSTKITITLTEDSTDIGGNNGGDNDYVIVSFNTNEGTPSIDDKTGKDSVTVSEITAVTKTNFTFGGWYTDSNFSNAITSLPFTVTSDITLYAKWNPIEVKITLDVLAADVTLSQTVFTTTAGSTINGIPSNLTRTGFSFTGWYTDSNCTTAVVSRQTYTRDTTIYAGWTPARFDIYYNLGGGSYVVNSTTYTDLYTQTYTYGQTVTKITPERELFNFAGWVDESGETYLFSTMPAEDIELTAKWTIDDPNTFFAYSVNIDGTYTIEGYSDITVAADTTEIEIPSLINQTKVTAIAANAFKGKSALTSVKIAEGIKYIYSNAFYGTNLDSTKSSLPSTLEYIGASALPNSWIYENTVGTGSTIYYQFDFVNTASGAILVQYNSGAAGVTVIPSGVFRIAPNAFKYSQDITIVEIPASVIYIDDGAFASSTLSELTINSGSGIKEVSSTAFSNTEWLTEKENEAGFIVLGDLLYKYCGFASSTTVVVPAVKYIAPDVFSGYTKLANITFANENLIEIIGAKAFYRTKWAENQEFSIINGILTNYYKEVSATDSVQIIVPETVKTIAANAFEYVKGTVINIVLPSTVEKLEEYAFVGFTKSNFKLTLLGENAPAASIKSFAKSATSQLLIKVQIYVKPGTTGNYLEDDTLNIWRLLPRLNYTYTVNAEGDYVISGGAYVLYDSVLHSGYTRYARTVSESISYIERAIQSIDAVYNLVTEYDLGDELTDVNGNTDLSLVIMTFTTNDGMIYINQRVMPVYISGYNSLTSTVIDGALNGIRTLTVSFNIPGSTVIQTYNIDYTINRSIFNVEVYDDSLITDYFLNQTFNKTNKNNSGAVAVLAVTYQIGTGASLNYETIYVNIDDAGVLIGNFVTTAESSAENVLEMSIEYDGFTINIPYTVSAMAVTGLSIKEYIENAEGGYIYYYSPDVNGNYIRLFAYTAYDAENPDHVGQTQYVHIDEVVSYALNAAGGYIRLYVEDAAGALVRLGDNYTEDAAGLYIRQYVANTEGDYVLVPAVYSFEADLDNNGEWMREYVYTEAAEGAYVYDTGTSTYIAYDEGLHVGFTRYDRAEGTEYVAYVEGADAVRYDRVLQSAEYYTAFDSGNPEHASYVRYGLDGSYVAFTEGLVGVRYTYVEPYYVNYDEVAHFGLTRYSESLEYIEYTDGAEGVRYDRSVVADYYAEYDDADPAHTGLTTYVRSISVTPVAYVAGLEGERCEPSYIAYDANNTEHAGYTRYIRNGIQTSGNVFAVMEEFDYDSYYITCTFDQLVEGSTTEYITRDILINGEVYDNSGYYFNVQGLSSEVACVDAVTTISYGEIETSFIYTVHPKTEQKHFQYELNGTEAVITGLNAGYPSTIYLPATINVGEITYNVTGVKKEAFMNYTGLNIVYVDPAITYIGEGAFKGSSIKEIHYQDNSAVTEIADYTFMNALNLQVVDFGANSSIEKIGMYAFSGAFANSVTILASISLPASVKTVDSYAFQESKLVSFTAASGLETINAYAFYNSKKLNTVTLPSTVTTLGAAAFANCSVLTTFRVPEGVTEILPQTFYNCDRLTEIYMNTTVDTIGYKAISNCERLTKISGYSNANINLVTIGVEAFSENYYLTALNINPATLVTIGDKALWYDTRLANIDLSTAATLLTIGSEAFSGTAITAVVIPASVTSLATDAFSYCTKVVSIDIRTANFTTVADYMFQGFTALNSVTLTEYVTSIGNYAFAQTTALTSLTLPQSLLSIGEGAFYESGITSLSLNSSLQSIGAYAFLNNTSLTAIAIPATVITIGEGAFMGCTGVTSLSLANGSCLAAIGAKAFLNDKLITSVSLPLSIATIGDSAFEKCNAMTSLTIAEGNHLTSIGANAFRDCSNLVTLNFGESVSTITTTIGNSAFARDYGLTEISLPASISSIGEKAFYNCTGLTTVYIGAKLTNMYVEASNSQLTDSELTKYVLVDNAWVVYDSALHSELTRYVIVSVAITKSAVTLENYTEATAAQIADAGVELFVRVNYAWVAYNRTNPDTTHTALTKYVYTANAQQVFYGNFIRSKLTAMGKYAFANTTSLTTIYSTIENPYAMYGVYTESSSNSTNQVAKQFGIITDGVFTSHFTDENFTVHIANNTENQNDTDRYTSWTENKSVLSIDIYLTADVIYLA